MGAEFVWVTTRLNGEADDWVDFVNSWDETTTRKFVDDTDNELFWSDIYEDDRLCEDVVARLLEAISVCYGYMSSREMGWTVDSDGTIVILTGGMTWGDEPTEAFREIILFDMLQLWSKQVSESS